MVQRIFRLVLINIYSIVVGWIFGFLLIETFPGLLTLIHLNYIKYYAERKEYVSDPALAFVYRRTDYVRRVSFVGDLFSPDYKISVKATDYVATYNGDGFRKNSSPPPYDIAVIGDSYIEFGETDETTFTEFLKRETGLSILNLGRGWYGPYQYLELLKRYVLHARPKYVFLAFFAGNDFNDITQYETWKSGGPYYFYRSLDTKNIISRFVFATGDVGDHLKRKIRSVLMNQSETRMDPAYLGMIRISNKTVLMALPHWEREVTEKELVAAKSLLTEFKSTCREKQIIPVLMYIPTATQVYAGLYAANSTMQFTERVINSLDNPSLRAIASLASELNMHFVDLLPIFKSEGSNGRLLYYPFDTHWNVEGRRTAAAFVADYLRRHGGMATGK